MSGTITPERALEIARELWPWANYIACDSTWITHCFSKRPVFDGVTWGNKALTASLGSHVAWPQSSVAERLLGTVIVPTDDDAKRRPLVMVKAERELEWFGPFVLLAVQDDCPSPFVCRRETGLAEFPACRLAIDGEVNATGGVAK